MRYEDYGTLKAASSVSFKKQAAVDEVKDKDGNVTTPFEPEYFYLEEKRWNSSTGVEEVAAKTIMSADNLEAEKTQLTTQKEALEAKITQLGKMITDIKAL